MQSASQANRSECYFCGEAEVLETHHIVPSRYDGRDDEENLVDVCPTCHSKLERLYDKRFYKRLGEYDGQIPHNGRGKEGDAESTDPTEIIAAGTAHRYIQRKTGHSKPVISLAISDIVSDLPCKKEALLKETFFIPYVREYVFDNLDHYIEGLKRSGFVYEPEISYYETTESLSLDNVAPDRPDRLILFELIKSELSGRQLLSDLVETVSKEHDRREKVVWYGVDLLARRGEIYRPTQREVCSI